MVQVFTRTNLITCEINHGVATQSFVQQCTENYTEKVPFLVRIQFTNYEERNIRRLKDYKG